MAGAAKDQDGASHQAYLARRRFGSLDGVRCLAIVAVVWHHSQPYEGGLATRGFLGVDLFFVLSGFLIVTLLLREREQHGRISLKDFYVRRSLRIFPIYYGLLALLALAYAVVPSNGADVFFAELPYLATYTANWIGIEATNLAPTWSLAAEEQFYLIWPAVECLLAGWSIWLVLALALVANQAVNFGLLDEAWRALSGRAPDLEILDATFTPILLGVLLARVMHRPRGYTFVARLAGARWSPLFWGAALLATVALSPGDISGLPRLAIQVLMMALLASLVVREDHLARRTLSWRPLARLGAISYGMYLFHMFALHGVHVVLDRVPQLDSALSPFLLGLAATILIAELSFRYFETWFLGLKRRFQR